MSLLWHLNTTIALRGNRSRNWFHGISCDGNNHSEISTSEKRQCHSLSSVRHRGPVWQIHQGGRGRSRALFRNGLRILLFPFWYSPVEIFATHSFGEIRFPLRFWKSIRMCRMVVACKVSLKQCLNFWTCHLAFLPCKCMWTLPAFVLQAEDGIREVGLCVNFSH